MKRSKFTWKCFPPGTDYGNVTLIEGPPGALRDALEDIAWALGSLDPDYNDVEVAAGCLNEALRRHGLAWKDVVYPVSSPGTKGVRYQQFKSRKEWPWDNSDRPFAGPQTTLKEVIRDIDEALFQIVEIEEIKEGAYILIDVLSRHGLTWEGSISPSPVIEEQVR